ncbi:Peptide methionine sulfoxide reductase MsrA [Botrimarina colliarenosi]|uniref:Peptide methionine sulfoxide reductase MsrA n=1 Tax=Botrimarina colliarenosi TaxID=2528001 RepID=A0A5C6AGU2_9BACT|nr:peptide-methionine (S)-S-oxide reductase MsrA [Botrimarina colliarenosi]TWT99194.1 Peptide methionine sulfoxide reductase MsrA [Botrimarina colliarenosi]
MTARPILLLAAAATLTTLGALPLMSADAQDRDSREAPTEDFPAAPAEGHELATFGGGCFWCTEAVYEATAGVDSAVSGYAGGQTINPTYEAVCTGQTGHAEVIQVAYDPAVVSYKDLLQIFFRTHDPTTLNRQGADVGTQYRSAIFYHDDEQRQVAEEVKAALDKAGAFSGPIVTEIAPLETFYAAEPYHQDYFAKNPTQGYCRAVVAPKLEKYRKAFADKLKP